MSKDVEEARNWISNNPKTYITLLYYLNEASKLLIKKGFIDEKGNIINKVYEKELMNIINEYNNEFRTVIGSLSKEETYVFRRSLSSDSGFPLKARAIGLELQKSEEKIIELENKVYYRLMARIYFSYPIHDIQDIVCAYEEGFIISEEILNMPLTFIIHTSSSFTIGQLLNSDSKKVRNYLGEVNFSIVREFIHNVDLCFSDEDIIVILTQNIDKGDQEIKSISERRNRLLKRREYLFNKKEEYSKTKKTSN